MSEHGVPPAKASWITGGALPPQSLRRARCRESTLWPPAPPARWWDASLGGDPSPMWTPCEFSRTDSSKIGVVTGRVLRDYSERLVGRVWPGAPGGTLPRIGTAALQSTCSSMECVAKTDAPRKGRGWSLVPNFVGARPPETRRTIVVPRFPLAVFLETRASVAAPRGMLHVGAIVSTLRAQPAQGWARTPISEARLPGGNLRPRKWKIAPKSQIP